MAKNTSRSNQCFCSTKSAFDKNLKANANSKNPNETFTVFIHPPERGIEFNQPGNMANNINGNAKANEKPNIPTNGAKPPLDAASTNSVPTIGPVHENDTIANANAIKKIPINPPRSACLSTLFAHEFGNMISNAPKNEDAKTTSITKKIMLNHIFVDRAFNASAPKILVTINPKST